MLLNKFNGIVFIPHHLGVIQRQIDLKQKEKSEISLGIMLEHPYIHSTTVIVIITAATGKSFYIQLFNLLFKTIRAAPLPFFSAEQTNGTFTHCV